MTRHVTKCPDCDTVERADVGGVAFGGCDTCNGTGLILESE